MYRDRLLHSVYLTDLERHYPELLEQGEPSLALLENEIANVRQLGSSELDIGQRFLRQSKARFDYIWGSLKLANLPSFADAEPTADSVWDFLGDLATLRSRYADATVSAALSIAWTDKRFSKYIPAAALKSLADGTPVAGLFVLGMGKLGGYDLNFSSDIDLIAFYDPESLPVSEMNGRTDVCARVLQVMTQILSTSIEGEFVWRVDWRLRPDASVTPIVMSTVAANDFYHFRSLPWHRLAMIKARPIAGDLATGQQFLKELESYLWRQNLDYSAVDDIRRLKQKINQEHPQLRLARIAEAQGLDQLEGFNLKLGRGGIREIEFMANAMQLLWGGKRPSLRTYRTIDVLENLQREALFEPQLAELLIEHYLRLRVIEDLLQMRANLQTHSLPKSVQGLDELDGMLGLYKLDKPETLAALDRLDRLDGAEEPSSVAKIVAASTEKVEREYDRFFSRLSPDLDTEQLQPVTINSEAWFDELPKAEKAIVQDWYEGFSLYAVSPANRHRLVPLFNWLVALMDSASLRRENPAAVVDKLHQFFRSIPKGGQYLRLLAAQPNIFKDVLQPLVSSPAMGILLQQSPHIIDYLLEPRTPESIEFDDAFVVATTDFEVRLRRFRRFVNEQLYDRMLGLFNGRLGAIELQKQLTALAEHCLELGSRITEEDMGLSDSPISILGMGKLGMGAMAPLSDLDLIFIAQSNVDLEQANRFSNRLRHLMEVKTAEGRAYEMDTRLRPSGRSGPVTVSIDGFERYHLKSARSWEHIALASARTVSGAAEEQIQIQALRARILSKKRSRSQFLMDAAKMHWRVRSQRIDRASEHALNVKLRRGGMFETDYLCACLMILGRESEQSFLLEYDQLAEKVLVESGYPEIVESISFWRSLQVWSRILGLEEGALESIDRDKLDLLLADMQLSSPEALTEEVLRHSELVGAALEGVLSEVEGQVPKEWSDWDEVGVVWE